jgi:transcriptional regulator with XRE-family HTH domain
VPSQCVTVALLWRHVKTFAGIGLNLCRTPATVPHTVAQKYPHAHEGRRLRAARIAAGLKRQGDLAELLETGRERISGWETGRVRISDDYRTRIKDKLGLDLDAEAIAEDADIASQLADVKAELAAFRSLLTRHGPESVAAAIHSNVEVIPGLLRKLGKAIQDIGKGIDDLQDRLTVLEARLAELPGWRRAEPR